MNESIKEYLRHIGSKGGKAVAGTPQAKARAAKAAKARWHNGRKPNEKKLILTAFTTFAISVSAHAEEMVTINMI